MAKYSLHNLNRKLHRLVVGDDLHRSSGICKSPPEWLVLCINNFCNLHCKMCDVGLQATDTVFYANLIGDHPQNMTFELLQTILAQARDFRPKPKVGLAFTEPLIHKDILDFCREIKRRGFYCSVTSNGFRLPELAEELVSLGLDFITISVDGSETVHDSIRGKQGSFARIIQGVENLNHAKQMQRKKRPAVQFSYTITDENYTDMVNFVQQIEFLNVDSLVFSHLNFITPQMAEVHNAQYNCDLSVVRSNLGSMDLQLMDLQALLNTLDELRNYRFKQKPPPALVITPDMTELQPLDVYYRQPLQFIGGRTCSDPFRLMMIKTDGTVIPAHGRCYNFPVGNIAGSPLKTLWNGTRYREFRKILQQAGGTLPACARCCGVIGKPQKKQVS